MGKTKAEKATVEEHHECVSLDELKGQKIEIVYDCDRGWKRYTPRVSVHPEAYLYAEVPLKGDCRKKRNEELVLIEPYGNDDIGEELTDRFWGRGMFAKGYTAGVLQKSGEIVLVGAIKEKGKYGLAFFNPLQSETLRIPQKFAKRLREMKGAKRPFNLAFDWRSVLALLSRDSSYYDLQHHGLQFEFRFNKETLIIWGDRYMVRSREEVVEHD